MSETNRREFIRRAAAGSATAAAGLAMAGFHPRRTFAQSAEGFNRIAFRHLGSTGCKVSEVGFGAMNMRDEELVRAAIANGINYIDTAHSYMNGENERIVGRVMKSERDKVFLTTKIKYDNSGIDPKNMPGMIETSLKRLQTDHVDLLLLHICDSRDQVLRDDLIKVFENAKKRGQTRFVGVSTHQNQAEVMDAAVESKFWEAVLVGYSYVSPSSVREAIERTRKAGLGIIGMKNLLQLTARPRPPITEVPKYAIPDIKPQQALIKWVLDDRYVDTTIPGMTTFEHLADDIAVMSMPMSFGARRTLYHFGENTKGSFCRGTSGCTGCQGQCPNGVEICEINRCLGYAYGYGDMELARENYRDLPDKWKIDVCDDCDECAVSCINGLDLTETVQFARELFA